MLLHKGRRERWVFVAFLVTLVWAPLPLASNRTWSVALLAVLLSGLLLLALALRAGRGAPSLPRLKDARLPLLALCAYVGVVCLQLVPLPDSLLAALGAEGGRVLSVDPFNTQQYLVASVAYVASFVLVLIYAGDERRLRSIAQVLIASALFQALLGIVLFSLHAKYRLFYFELDHRRVLGTFGYHNHAAGYLEMCLSLGVGLMAGQLRSGVSPLAHSLKTRLIEVLRFFLSAKMRLRLMLVIMVIALVLTRSRMGNSAFFISLFVTGLLAMWASRRVHKGALWLLVSLVVVDLVIVGHWVGVDKVVERLEETSIVREESDKSESVEERTMPVQYGLPMLAERPLLGFGGGTFYAAFPAYKGDLLRSYYDHAHNDYLEVALDTGLLGLSLLAIVVLATLWRAYRLLCLRQDALGWGLAFGCLMGCLCLVLHSLVDFNLQAPANALTCCVMLAMVWGLRLPAQQEPGNSHQV